MAKILSPRHVAIIPDGNRRWAKRRGFPGWKGHFEGAKRMEEIARAAVDLDIKYLTIWGGSYDNLTKRSKGEIIVLNRVYKELVQKLLKDKTVHENKVRVRFLGEWPKLLNKGVVEVIKRAESETARYTGYQHSYLVGYNGDREMLDAMNRLLKAGHGRVTALLLKSYLWTADLPPVDLVIRTGGEPHLSNGFMMWDIRDAQLYFTDKFWPDFTKEEFVRALEDYSHRERRFGQ